VAEQFLYPYTEHEEYNTAVSNWATGEEWEREEVMFFMPSTKELADIIKWTPINEKICLYVNYCILKKWQKKYTTFFENTN
jgi:hypothetical protein